MSGQAHLHLGHGRTVVVIDNNKYDLTGAVASQAQSIFANTSTLNGSNVRAM